MNDIHEYISRKGWRYREQGKELVLDECPLCKDTKKHFYMSEDGLWKCHKCGESGNLFQLKKALGDILQPVSIGSRRKLARTLKKDVDTPHRMLLESDSTMKWLRGERGLTEETIKRFGLILEDKRIGFPYRQGGQLVGVKWRTRDKQITREPGCDSTMYNIDALKPDKPVILVEGEFDVMATVQLGFENVISGSNGAGSFSEDWIQDFADAPEIFIAYDNDKAGEDGAKRAAGILGRWRCRRVRLPFKDFNDCLINGATKADIQEYFDTAKPYCDADLIHATDLLVRTREDIQSKERQGVRTGWRDFDTYLGGLRPGEVTTLTGDTSVGKTTFAANLAYRLIDEGVVFVSTETSPEKIMRKLYAIHLSTPVSINTPEASLSVAEQFFGGKRLFFLDVHGEVGFERIRDTLEYTRRYGVKFAVLDHLHFFLTSKSLDSDRIEIERFMRSLVKLARSTGMHVFLVCHPAKIWEPREGDPPIVKPNDLKGSAAIKQDSHNIFSLWRNPATQSGATTLYIQKVRDDSGFTGKVKFSFDIQTQTYHEKEA